MLSQFAIFLELTLKDDPELLYLPGEERGVNPMPVNDFAYRSKSLEGIPLGPLEKAEIT